MIYCGIKMICPGIIIVHNIAVNRTFLPLYLILAKEYATQAELTTVANVAITVTIKEFLKKVAKVIPPNPFHPFAKFSHLQFGGIKLKEPFKISTLFFKEPVIIHKTGYTMTKPKQRTNVWYSTLPICLLNFKPIIAPPF